MATTTYNRQINKCFQVDEDFFIRLERMANEAKIDLIYEIGLTDHTRIDGLKHKELMEFPNSSSRRIESLDIATKYDSELRVRISLDNSMMMPISIRLTGDDKQVSIFSKNFEDLISDKLSWYHVFPHSIAFYYLLCACLIALATYPFVHSFDDLKDLKTGELLLLPTILLLPLIVVFYFQALLKKCFPVVQFLIGTGIQRAQKLASIHKLFFITIFVGALINPLLRQLFTDN